ncbi:MAG TPA: dynamin family protein, partial [Aggregatilineales bacterium]|nr:dynamin family protein [Aggregatilineales bacterium]
MLAPNSKALTDYESVRRKEHDTLAALLDSLTRVDGLPEDQMEQARDALFHADHPFLIVLVGAFNTGKSSIVNALIGHDALDVGATPTTGKIAILRYGPTQQRLQAGDVETVFDPAPMLERLSLVDTPGLDSVFKEHDALTQRFLHRADLVWLVMLATQAMSAASVASIQSLRAYGKRVIILVNQVDTLEAGEQETLKAFIAEQSQLHLSSVPPIWMISARQAIQARQHDPRDETQWQASGFAAIERYLADTLGNSALMRQKLETPIQIGRNVLLVASARVREQQTALADTRRAAQSVRAQVEAATREQQAALAETKDEMSRTFAEAIRRG